jgi:predicted transcriptional regulator
LSIKEEGEEDKSTTAGDLDTFPVSKYMTKIVMTANLDQTIQSVCKVMSENNVGGIVVVKRGINGNEPVGIITERDIIRKIGDVDLFDSNAHKRINE